MQKLLTILTLVGSSICLLATIAMAGTTLTYANFPPAKTFPCVQMEMPRSIISSHSLFNVIS